MWAAIEPYADIALAVVIGLALAATAFYTLSSEVYMCTLPISEQNAAMDDMGEGLDERATVFMAQHQVNQDAQFSCVHELAEHFEPEPLAHITWREALWVAGAPLIALAIVLGLAWVGR